MSNIYDRFDAATRDLAAWGLILNGKPVARIIRKHSKSGTSCTAFVQFWGAVMVSARINGGGFDRDTAAIEKAAGLLIEKPIEPDYAEGWELFRATMASIPDGQEWNHALKEAGFTVTKIID